MVLNSLQRHEHIIYLAIEHHQNTRTSSIIKIHNGKIYLSQKINKLENVTALNHIKLAQYKNRTCS